jgi:uncharacterized membrane protein
MRLAVIGLGVGAIVLLIPALIYWRVQTGSGNRAVARVYLVPGLIVFAIAAVFAVMWVIRHLA